MWPGGKLLRELWQAVVIHFFPDGHSLERGTLAAFCLALLILAISFFINLLNGRHRRESDSEKCVHINHSYKKFINSEY